MPAVRTRWLLAAATFVSRILAGTDRALVGGPAWHVPFTYSPLSNDNGRVDINASIQKISSKCSFAASSRLSARVVVATVRGDEHGDGRPAIGFDFVVVLRSRLIEARDNQEIGSFEKRGKQAGGPERIRHVQNRLCVQLTQQGLDLGDDMGGAGFVMKLA
jgi:hypothetical protein